MLRIAIRRWRRASPDLWIAAFFLAALNLLTLMSWHAWRHPTRWLQLWDAVPGHYLPLLIGTGVLNLAAWLLLRALQRRIIQPWRSICRVLGHATETLTEERGQFRHHGFNLREAALTFTRFAAHSQEAFARYQHMQQELEQSRALLGQIMREQQTLLDSANRGIIDQYRQVLAYANYLDEHIARHQHDAQLRYDFDDLCESGFNLKLIAQSLELLRSPPPPRQCLPLTRLLQQTMIALAPALERRSMKLSTLGAEEEVLIASDPRLVNNALWMMLFGIIRYAAPESTLRLRCQRNRDGEALLSIIVSELSPGQLTPEERYDYLLRQLEHYSPHMFAETVRLHGNVQLAHMLLNLGGGRIDILPITSYACEIAVFFPIMTP